MSARLERTTSALGLEVGAVAVIWSGPVAAAAPDVLVRWSLSRDTPLGETLARAALAGDARAMDAVVREVPMPAPLLDVLAERCVAVAPAPCVALASGQAAVDARWQRALVRAAGAGGLLAGAVTESAPSDVLLTADLPITHVSAAPGGRLLALAASGWDDNASARAVLYGVVDGDVAVLGSMTAPPASTFLLLTPIDAGRDTALVMAFTAEAARIWRFASGAPAGAWHVRVSEPAQSFTETVAGLWLHGENAHVLLARGEQEHEPPSAASEPTRVFVRGPDAPRGRLASIGGLLPLFSPPVFEQGRGYFSRELSWLDLEAGSLVARAPWGRVNHRLLVTSDALLASTDTGVFRLRPGAAEECLVAGDSWGLMPIADALLVGQDHEVRCLAGGATRFATRTADLVFDLVLAPGGVIALGMQRWTWLDQQGHVREASDDGRDAACVRLPNGTTAVSAGPWLLVISASDTGEPRSRRLRLPYDGQLLGATDHHFVFGPCSGGVPRLVPDALYAIDGDGICDRLAPALRPERIFYGGGTTTDRGLVFADGVLITRERALHRWRPRLHADARPAPAMAVRTRVVQGERVVRYDTVNPRDDWPEPGLYVVDEELCARDSTYGGTTGVAPAPAALIEDGAIAVFIDCTLTNGGRVELTRGSSAFFIGCTFESAPARSDRDDTSRSGSLVCAPAAGAARGPEQWPEVAGCHVVCVDCRLTKAG